MDLDAYFGDGEDWKRTLPEDHPSHPLNSEDEDEVLGEHARRMSAACTKAGGGLRRLSDAFADLRRSMSQMLRSAFIAESRCLGMSEQDAERAYGRCLYESITAVAPLANLLRAERDRIARGEVR